jgi:hypothetical protein
MFHLNRILKNYPLYKPNQKMFQLKRDMINEKDVNATTGWSCNFDFGLCEGWRTIGEIKDVRINFTTA